ncbi:MAG: YqaA family protein [Candidatus Nanoarchaeia archaeon]
MSRLYKKILIIFFVIFLIVLSYLHRDLIQEVFATIITFLGLSGVFIVSFFLDIIFFQPISPAIFLVSMIYSGEAYWFFIFLAVSFGSLLGSVVDYMLGRKYGHYIFNFFISDEKTQRVKTLFNKYANYTIMIGAFTPVPYSLICWSSGMSKIPFKIFITYAIIARSALFLLLSLLTHYGLLNFLL